MNCIHRRIVPAVLVLGPVLTFTAPVQAQNSVTASARPAISVLDSTKEQDGLVGSVRRVKTETARIEVKDGRSIEGAPQLVEITTYGIKGNRIENTSYPIAGSLVGKEEYKYDKRGNITEMTLRDDSGAILSREAYTYEFDKFGNWTRMVTNLVVFENGELKREPIEVTYRTLTYYFDDNVAKVIAQPAKPPAARERAAATEQAPEQAPERAPEPAPEPAPEALATAVPQPVIDEIRVVDALKPEPAEVRATEATDLVGEPPPLIEKITKAESAFAARKGKEEILEPAPVAVTSVQKLANDLYLNGRAQFDAGDMRGAVESFLHSVKLEPGSAEVFLNLAHAYLKLEKDRDAIKAFKESIKLNPEAAETHYGLGFANFRTRKFNDAADAFKKAIEIDPRMAKAHYGLALAYQETGYTHGLLTEYRVLERLDSSLAQKLAQTFPQFNFSCRLLNGCE